MSQGTIVQCIGAVVDIQFPRDSMPKVYDALKLEDAADSFAEAGRTFEVQQQLGDGVVRTIALGSSDGLRRGMKVSGTGKPISVPVGMGTLGRIMDVLGRPIDDAGPIETDELRAIHQKAPKFDELFSLICSRTSASMVLVPMPMSPSTSMKMLEVGASGRIRSGSCEPLVTSRMKKLVSLPATSQVCGWKPDEPSCCRRSVGVSPSMVWISTDGVDVPLPIRPPSST